MKTTSNKKIIIGVLVLILAFAAIFGGLHIAEAVKNKDKTEDASEITAREKTEKQEKLDEIEDSAWGEDNTLYLGDDMYGFDHRIETYLFIGTDNTGSDYADQSNKTTKAEPDTEESDTSDTSSYQGSMADFLLLMVIDHTDDTYGFLQIDRNTITSVTMLDEDGEPEGDAEQQICNAHWYGTTPEESAENTVEAVKMVIGEPENIDGYYVLNMGQLGKLNAIVDGVEVTIEDDMTNVDPAFKKGATLTLDDEQAEAFIRARMAVGDGKNEGRMRRQRAYINGFLGKALAKVREHPNFANTLWDTFKDVAVTDLSGNDFSRIAESFRADESKGILTYEGEITRGETLGDGEMHEEFYPDEESVKEVLTELYTLELIQ